MAKKTVPRAGLNAEAAQLLCWRASWRRRGGVVTGLSWAILVAVVVFGAGALPELKRLHAPVAWAKSLGYGLWLVAVPLALWLAKRPSTSDAYLVRRHAEPSGGRSILPGSMLPGSMLPGSMLPGSMLPGSMLPSLLTRLQLLASDAGLPLALLVVVATLSLFGSSGVALNAAVIALGLVYVAISLVVLALAVELSARFGGDYPGLLLMAALTLPILIGNESLVGEASQVLRHLASSLVSWRSLR